VKKAGIIVPVLLLSGVLFAQVHGVPPSVTSFAPGRSMAPGVPASVTSLGPNGYSGFGCVAGCNGYFPFYPNGFAKPVHNGGHHGGGNHGGGNKPPYRGYGGGYAYIPYAVPYAVPVEPEMTDEQSAYDVQEPEPPAPTVFERRPVVQPAPYSGPPMDQSVATAEPRHANLSPVSEEKIPVVIVFKDGHKQEIGNGNYAIVGDMLYDLSGPIAHKIKLADLDLNQTMQLNEQRGVEFSLPAGYKPQA
jgi:hypothetical protein